MQLPQHIIDLVGTLFDQGQDDETIIFAALQAWRESCMLRSDQVSVSISDRALSARPIY